MSTITIESHTIPDGDFEIDLFQLSGLKCIASVEITALDLPPDTDSGISFGDVSCWDAWHSFELTSQNGSQRLWVDPPRTEACCWSRGQSASSAPDVPTGDNMTGGPREVKVVIIGLIDDCDGSGSSSAPYGPCSCS